MAEFFQFIAPCLVGSFDVFRRAAPAGQLEPACYESGTGAATLLRGGDEERSAKEVDDASFPEVRSASSVLKEERLLFAYPVELRAHEVQYALQRNGDGRFDED